MSGSSSFLGTKTGLCPGGTKVRLLVRVKISFGGKGNPTSLKTDGEISSVHSYAAFSRLFFQIQKQKSLVPKTTLRQTNPFDSRRLSQPYLSYFTPYLFCSFCHDDCKEHAFSAARRNHSVRVSAVVIQAVACVQNFDIAVYVAFQAALEDKVKFLSLMAGKVNFLVLFFLDIRGGNDKRLRNAVFIYCATCRYSNPSRRFSFMP